jgi:DNA-binding NtrC family response regulator
MKNKQTSILIVDDDVSTREMLVTFLSSRYSCTTAASAEKAIGLLTFWPFDLVITAQELPGVSGLALCQSVRKLRPDTAVILMYETISSWHRTVAEWLGVLDCIKKPCDLLFLLKLIEHALLSGAQTDGLEINEPVESVHQTT